ncbi:hypothetical protein FB451DRAFT_1502584 [Mycena latifolia]|nr:hypothetical protein FB451DRAFT_1502584 [Mycena latifolia]
MSTSERSLFVTLAAQAGATSVQRQYPRLAGSLVPPKTDLIEPILIDRRPVVARPRPRSDPQTRSLSPPVSAPPTDVPSRPPFFVVTLVHTICDTPQTLETVANQPLNLIPRILLRVLHCPCQTVSKASERGPAIFGALQSPNGTHYNRHQLRHQAPQIEHRLRATMSFRRASGPRNPSSPATSSAAPSSGISSASPTGLTPSYFSRKTTRRVSTPVPRTQPYAYPYYAQPPVEDEGYAAYLRNLPQFGTDAAPHSPPTSDSEEKEKDSPLFDRRGRNRKTNTTAQAALGLGRPVRPPQRSASESWAAGKDPRL